MADLALLFFFGAGATAGQTVLLREVLVAFTGNELSIGLSFAAWFAGIGIAASLANRIRLSPLAAVPLLPLVSAIGALLARLMRMLFNVPPGQYASIGPLALGTLLVLGPPAVVLGLTFPALVGLAKRDGASPHDPVSRVYVLESLGSLFSGALLSLWLIGRVDPFSTLIGLAALSALAGLPLARSGRARIALTAAGLALAIPLVLGLGPRLDFTSAKARFGSMAPSAEPLRFAESPYQHLVLAESAGQYIMIGSGTILAAFPDPYTAALEVHPAMCQAQKPRNALLLGEPTLDVIQRARMHCAKVDIVDLDPIAKGLVASVQPGIESMEGVRWITADPRRYLIKTEDHYDVIISFMPDPSTLLLNRFATKEFFEAAEARLAKGGVLAITVQSGENFLAGDVGAFEEAVYQALRATFDRVLISPGERTIFYATDGYQATEDPGLLARRYDERGIKDPVFASIQFKDLFPQERILSHRQALESRPHDQENTDLRPIAPYLDLILWDRYSGGSLAPVLRRLSRAGSWTFALGLGLISAIAGIIVFRSKSEKRVKRACSLAIGTTGTVGMATYILLINGFQNHFGSLYQQIGLFTAAFMAGLAIGSLLGRRITGRVRLSSVVIMASSEVLVWISIGIVWLAAADPTGVAAGLGQGWWYVIMCLLGCTTGFAYPAGVKLLGAEDARTSASLLEAADHIGAMAGSLLCGIALIPLAGVPATALALWLMKLPILVMVLRLKKAAYQFH